MGDVTRQSSFIGYTVPMATTGSSCGAALFVADNFALDFINTEYGTGEKRCDCLVDDQSVVEWLKAAGQLPLHTSAAPRGLLALARRLRAVGRSLVEAAKTGHAADADVVNLVLERGRPIKELAWDPQSSSFKVTGRPRADDAASLLEPVGAAIVNLLTKANLDLVRQCEGTDCTLLFHDLTKSHRRRWCSMAICGNRMKVAAFRSRKKVE